MRPQLIIIIDSLFDVLFYFLFLFIYLPYRTVAARVMYLADFLLAKLLRFRTSYFRGCHPIRLVDRLSHYRKLKILEVSTEDLMLSYEGGEVRSFLPSFLPESVFVYLLS